MCKVCASRNEVRLLCVCVCVYTVLNDEKAVLTYCSKTLASYSLSLCQLRSFLYFDVSPFSKKQQPFVPDLILAAALTCGQTGRPEGPCRHNLLLPRTRQRNKTHTCISITSDRHYLYFFKAFPATRWYITLHLSSSEMIK